jgi:predicted MFS family arabinose efflux permease
VPDGPTRAVRPGYAMMALVLLTLANALNLADRMILGVLQEDLRLEFHLTDLQLGLLGGTSFAILYSLLTIPIARLADRANRITVVSSALAIWSGMTAACGMAVNFGQLLLSRVGVSIGEAGGIAPALSYFSDIFRLERRATAMAVFSMGGPAGALIATALGGWLGQTYGWRAAFICFGVAGLILAVLIRLMLREVRTKTHKAQVVSLADAVRIMLRKRSYLHVCVAGIIAAFAATFIMQYMTSFLIRVHGLPLAKAALITGMAGGVMGMCGAFGAGWLADRLSRQNPARRTQVLIVCFILAAISLSTAWWMPLALAIALLLLGALVMNAYPGVSYAVASMTAPSHLRATAIAMFTLVSNLIGYAMGPAFLGFISDRMAARSRVTQGLSDAVCQAQPGLDVCIQAQGEGLRIALTFASVLLIGAAFHHWRAGLTLAADIEE